MPKAKIEYEGVSFEVEVTDQALDDIRFKFNPSNLDKVTKLKTVAAVYISLLTELNQLNPNATREFAIARTDMQKVSMCAVLAATKGLPQQYVVNAPKICKYVVNAPKVCETTEEWLRQIEEDKKNLAATKGL